MLRIVILLGNWLSIQFDTWMLSTDAVTLQSESHSSRASYRIGRVSSRKSITSSFFLNFVVVVSSMMYATQWSLIAWWWLSGSHTTRSSSPTLPTPCWILSDQSRISDWQLLGIRYSTRLSWSPSLHLDTRCCDKLSYCGAELCTQPYLRQIVVWLEVVTPLLLQCFA